MKALILHVDFLSEATFMKCQALFSSKKYKKKEKKKEK